MSSLFWETISPDMRSILGGFSQSGNGIFHKTIQGYPRQLADLKPV